MSERRSPDGRHKRRARGTPRWLKTASLDEIARSRCLMLLSTLSGERAVTDVIEELGIARQTYMELEMRALKAMVTALSPGAVSEDGMDGKIAQLEKQVERLEREKRRAERLLLLTRAVMKPAPVVTPNRGRPSSKRSGKRPSRGSKAAAPATAATSATTPAPSTPTPASAGER